MKTWLIVIILVVIAVVVSGAFFLTQYNTTGESNSTSSTSETNEKEIFTKENSVKFLNEVLRNEKFGRHNLLWDSLDKPSQEVFGDVNDYEGFFNAIVLVQQEKNLKAFQINEEDVVLRDSWTSPQSVTYSPVYDIPVETTLNDGTTESATHYIFEVGGELKTNSSVTAKTYKEAKQELIDLGYLE